MMIKVKKNMFHALIITAAARDLQKTDSVYYVSCKTADNEY